MIPEIRERLEQPVLRVRLDPPEQLALKALLVRREPLEQPVLRVNGVLTERLLPLKETSPHPQTFRRPEIPMAMVGSLTTMVTSGFGLDHPSLT